jgi:hypothetical protein
VAADAIWVGRVGAGTARSKLGDVPMPAVPPVDLARAMRAGTAVGLPVEVLAWADAGRETSMGEAARGAARRERAGTWLDSA